MFVETKEAGEAQQAKVLKLSEAIRKGKPLVGNECFNFRFCALGCAWAGLRGALLTTDDLFMLSRKHPEEFERHVGEAIAKELGFHENLGERVSLWHSSGKPALEIADLLELRGY